VQEDQEHQTVDMISRIKAVHALSAKDPEQALRDAERLLEEYPDEPLMLTEMVRLYRMNKADKKTIEFGVKAIKLAAEQRNAKLALQIFYSFKKERHNLNLEKNTLDHMVRFFLEKEDFKEAAWCAYYSGVVANDLEHAQKRLMEVGDHAAQAQHPQCAQSVYKFYLKHHAQGSFADYATKAIQFQERILQSQGLSSGQEGL
jgi:hypothetical protein